MNKGLKPQYITEEFLEQRLEKFSRKLSKTIIKAVEKNTAKNINNFKNDYVMPMFAITHGHMATKEDLKLFPTKEDAKLYATKTDLDRFTTKVEFKELQTEVRKTGIMVEEMQKDLKTVVKIAETVVEHQAILHQHSHRLDSIEKSLMIVTTVLRKKDV